MKKEIYPIGVIVEDIATRAIRANAPTTKLYKKPDGKYYPFSFVQKGLAIDAAIIESDKERWKIIQPQIANTFKKEDEFVWCDNDIIEAWDSAYGGDAFLDGKDYLEYMKQIKFPTKIKLTPQMIADKFGVNIDGYEIINVEK